MPSSVHGRLITPQSIAPPVQSALAGLSAAAEKRGHELSKEESIKVVTTLGISQDVERDLGAHWQRDYNPTVAKVVWGIVGRHIGAQSPATQQVLVQNLREIFFPDAVAATTGRGVATPGKSVRSSGLIEESLGLKNPGDRAGSLANVLSARAGSLSEAQKESIVTATKSAIGEIREWKALNNTLGCCADRFAKAGLTDPALELAERMMGAKCQGLPELVGPLEAAMRSAGKRERLDSLIGRFPSVGELRKARAVVFLLEGESDKAVSQLRTLSQPSQRVEAMGLAVEELVRRGEISRAIQLCGSLAIREPCFETVEPIVRAELSRKERLQVLGLIDQVRLRIDRAALRFYLATGVSRVVDRKAILDAETPGTIGRYATDQLLSFYCAAIRLASGVDTTLEPLSDLEQRARKPRWRIQDRTRPPGEEICWYSENVGLVAAAYVMGGDWKKAEALWQEERDRAAAPYRLTSTYNPAEHAFQRVILDSIKYLYDFGRYADALRITERLADEKSEGFSYRRHWVPKIGYRAALSGDSETAWAVVKKLGEKGYHGIRIRAVL